MREKFSFLDNKFNNLKTTDVKSATDFLISIGFDLIGDGENAEAYASRDFPGIVLRVARHADNMLLYAGLLADNSELRNSGHALNIHDIVVLDNSVIYAVESLNELDPNYDFGDASDIDDLKYRYPRLNRSLSRYFDDFLEILADVYVNKLNDDESWDDLVDVYENVTKNVMLRPGKRMDCLVLADPLTGFVDAKSAKVIMSYANKITNQWPSVNTDRLAMAIEKTLNHFGQSLYNKEVDMAEKPSL